MKVVVPMAGRGVRLAQAGYEKPKPLVTVAGRPVVAWALESLRGVSYTELIFVALAEHEADYGVSSVLHSISGPMAKVILLDAITEGQLCTVLAAREFIETDEDLLIISADSLVVSTLSADIENRSEHCRGLISVANMPGDNWSFARTDETGRVVEVAEKVRISDYASTGLYYFSSGGEFVSVASEMIRNGEKTKGEYYVIPVYQKFIQRGLDVRTSVASEIWDMGTAAGLAALERRLIPESIQAL